MSLSSSKSVRQPKSATRLALKYAFCVPVLFGAAFFIFYPPIPSEAPFPEVSLFPVKIIFSLGIVGWVAMLVTFVRALHTPGARPSGITGFMFFLLFGFELWLAVIAIQERQKHLPGLFPSRASMRNGGTALENRSHHSCTQ